MKNILNRGFSEYSDDALVTKVRLIISQLTGNASFPSPKPTLVEVGAQTDALEAAMIIVDPQARKEAIKAARTTLEQMLDDLADYLEAAVNMDPVPLATTGFDLRKETEQTMDAPPIPQNLRLKLTGVSGETAVMFAASARAKGYTVQTATSADGPFTDYDTFSSSRNIVLKGFPRKQDLWVRVRANGPHNTHSGWSDPVRILID